MISKLDLDKFDPYVICSEFKWLIGGFFNKMI